MGIGFGLAAKGAGLHKVGERVAACGVFDRSRRGLGLDQFTQWIGGDSWFGFGLGHFFSCFFACIFRRLFAILGSVFGRLFHLILGGVFVGLFVFCGSRFVLQTAVGVPILVLLSFGRILLCRAGLVFIGEGGGYFGHVNGHRQSRSQPDHQTDDETGCGATLLEMQFHVGLFHILVGAETPNTFRPLCSTCAVAATKAKRACLTCSSSTRMRSAS